MSGADDAVRPQPSSFSQHRYEARYTYCCSQVLERVTAHNVSERENLLIGRFETLCCSVGQESDDEIPRSGIASRKQDDQCDD
jgi:hypothetical protein